MRLGIDFGTTHTVVACSDRGNYPVVGFTDDAGDLREHVPSLVAVHEGRLLFGFDALAAAEAGATPLRSFKRLLAEPRTTVETEVRLGEVRLPLGALIAGFLAHLRDCLDRRSNLPRRDGALQAVVAVPANAFGAQRFVTLDAFRRAGFEVRAVLNEPSAAGFEFTHRHGDTLSRRREHVVVYDLGGGTFDASLVRVSGARHEVLATAGVNRLGGDDFDERLLGLVLEAAWMDEAGPGARERALLLEACRDAKEKLAPSAKRILVDLESALGEGAPVREVSVPVSRFAEACQPLVDRTVEVMAPLLERLAGEEAEPGSLPGIAGIYAVGGGSGLPLVVRTLRERFGRRVHRSPYPSAATAIGLAIAADEGAGFELEDRFSRTFGVFREGRAGREVTFDPVFGRDLAVPGAGEADRVWTRTYRAAHNLGHFRFVECADLDPQGAPRGDLVPFADVLFPFDPALRGAERDLRAVPVRRSVHGPLIEERYSVDAAGIVQVRITDLDSGFARDYRLGGASA